ncbi:MAG: response regulator transcription factor [Candidatus Sumerlaeota bacterium]|nr:response regulator transcription factor [Candidatus Sumerlaeota bacterium]
MSLARILVVEDEPDILELIAYNLEKKSFQILKALTGTQGLELARAQTPDLILLDILMPELNGLDVCRLLKADPATSAIPIVIVSALGEEAHIVKGLELGADDYITKPFSPAVLLARVQAVLRRTDKSKTAEPQVIRRGSLTMDTVRHETLVDGVALLLTATEFRILQLLASRPGQVFTRAQIIRGAHGDNYGVTDRSIDVQIVGLRKKMATAGACIQTVRGVGYRFRDD